MPRRILPLLAIVALLAPMLAACQGDAPVVQVTPAPATAAPAVTSTALPPIPRVEYTPVPANEVSPVVIARSPERGEELRPDGAIQLTFDRPMNQAAVAAAFSLAPATPGSVEWPDARTLRFKPAAPLPRNSVFDVLLGQGARAQDGAQLNGAYQFRVATAGFLEAAQVIPAPGTADAQATSAVTVIFNRPVVPLVTAGQQASLPRPLRLEPAVAGEGEWLNTSVYVFRPDQPLQGGATYTGRVDGALVDAAGNPMAGEFTWQFSVAAPQVIGTDPTDAADHVSAEPTLRVQFNQPLPPNAQGVSVTLAGGGETIATRMEAQGDTLLVTPTQRLQFGARYTAQLSGAGLPQPFGWSFTTAPLPELLSVTPADGAGDVRPFSEIVLQFNTVMDAESIWRNLALTPALPATGVYSYFNEYDYGFHLYPGLKPSTSYELRIGPGLSDPYGNLVGDERTVRFRTGPLDPSVQLLAPDPAGTYAASQPARVVLSSVNAARADMALFSIGPREIATYTDWRTSPPPASALVRRWSQALDAPLDQTVSTRVDLAENNGRLAPGVYLLQLDFPGAQYARYHVMVVSDLNLTLKAGPTEALAWANALRDGAPAAGIALTFYGDNGQALGSATTDASGLARVRLTPPNQSVNFVAGGCANGEASCATFAATSRWWGTYSASAQGVPQSYDIPGLSAYVYTDRPIYRPGQQVDFKGIVRRDDDAQYSLPSGLGSAALSITAPDGSEVLKKDVQLSALGTFADSLALAPGAALGQYNITVQAGDRGFSFPFTVAAYRAPEFEVQVSTPAAETVRGAATAASVQVSYFFGGPVANVPVQWNVLAEPYRFSPPALGAYSFGDADDSMGRCWECWWQPPAPPTPILSGSGTTDAQGRLQIAIPADLRDAQGDVISDSVRLTVEATATGNDNQTLAGRGELVVHKGDLYLGLATRQYVGAVNSEQQVDLVTVDTAGKRLAGRAVTVRVQRIAYQNTFVADASGVGGSWQTQETRATVEQQTLTTDAQGAATLRFTPAEGGNYRVTASATDGGGRAVASSVTLWVAGSEFIPWRRDADDRLTLVSDRTSYKPGETASILIPSPFTGPTWALVTVERGGILKSEVLKLQSNSAVYQLPIAAEHAPNIFFSVALFTGSDSSPNAQTPTADYKLGYLPLQVEPAPQTLRVTLTPDRTSAQPGDTVTFAVQASDASGAPVAAELSLDLVDKAVLSLLPRTKDAIVGAFYGERGLSVQTSTGLSVSANRLLAQLEKQLADQLQNRSNTGTGAAGGATAGEPTSAPAAAEAAPMPAADQAQRAGGPAQQAPPPAVREQFADTALWQPILTTDASGRGSLSAKLPDNLSTWVLRGVAVDGDTRVGEATVEVLSTKPLLVRPVAPRFLVVGDTAELAANVSNNTDASLDVDVTIATKGVTVTGSLTQRLQVPARGEAQARWSALVGDAPAADLVFSAQGGGHSDAARPRLATGPDGTLPIYRYSVPETVGTGGQLAAAGSRTEVVALPPDLDDSRGELTLRLDPSLAAGMRDALGYLEHYEYECTEQTVSRFLPNVLTAKALRDLGVADADLEARLPALVKEGLDRLALRQHDDGGWGWWSDDDSNVHISAYVVLGLIKAKQAGYSVNDDMLSRGVAYLQSSVAQVDVTTSAADANQQAFVLYVLSEGQGGAGQGAALQSLLKLRAKLSVYAKALLAMALGANNAADPALKTLLADLNTAAITSATGAHWEESERDWWSMNTDTRTTAIALQALTRLDGQNQLNPNIVRWLMVARRGGVWETTQETSWALMALTEWMQRTGELKGEYDYATWLNDNALASGRVAPAAIDEPVVQRVAVQDLLRDAGNRVTVARAEGPGVLYYTAHLNAYLPVEKVQALDRGVTVRRRYTLASCADGPGCPEITQAKLGDVIRVDITLVTPNDLYYLRLEDPLPAGAEAVDTGLATTSMLAQEPGLERPDEGRWGWWWRWYSRSELRDEKVALFADYLSRGTYEYSYTMRATLPGTFHVIPTTASEFYFPDVYGRSDGQVLTISR